MHTYEAKNGTTFNHNSDLSGNVHIRAHDGPEYLVPGDDFLEFVAEFVRGHRIAALEDASAEDVLGLPAAQ